MIQTLQLIDPDSSWLWTIIGCLAVVHVGALVFWIYAVAKPEEKQKKEQ
eukprot:CAMPEP_0184292702 /NCGR_PEP_ID=MMETSP1049-20130417/4423_1 /TAXON_ID=77928 /ORGANISM="Proteomonas sulcata, Strain CCMP704" /LENGTH=48 /DNA_ID= /DNA_START= /DNA_END= /DNA_ORIENTATION=